jgi:2-C-methyl-D-erythritol 4-phosphate cytidylyltransferase
MRVTAIIPAAGKGVRFKSSIAKPLVNLNKKPILIHTLNIFSNHDLIDDIVVVFNRKDIDLVKKEIDKFKIKKIRKIIPGGSTRRQSVENGLQQIDTDTDLVLIHDGVRPFIDDWIIYATINAAKRFGAAIAAVPIKPTIKKVDSSSLKVKCTLEREMLWEAQTPQVFKKDIILEAYKRFRDKNAIDDACLVERLGQFVKIIKGSYKNIKITTPEDLEFARVIKKRGI